jgi:hypothetical protein
MKSRDPARSPKGELNFAYISTGVLIVFIFLAAMKCTGQRNDPAILPVPPIEAH